MTKKPTKKPKTTRSQLKYPALSPSHNLRNRYDEIDDMASYMNQLNDEEKEWLNAFAQEEVCANFNHGGPKINDASDPAVRSRIYNRNNQRNRCIMSQEISKGTLHSLEELDIDKEERAFMEENREDTYET